MKRFRRMDALLGEARAWVMAHLSEGRHCPCCDQFAKRYKRRINSGMAISLIKMWRHSKLAWQHIPSSIGGRSREEGKLRYWGLVEEMPAEREDGGRAGWWRVTEKGRDWLLDLITVQRYVFVYDAVAQGFDGPPTSVKEALGKKFNYDELMGKPEEDDDDDDDTLLGLD